MFEHILVPVDLTSRNRRAIELAGTLCAGEGEVTVLHVIETLDLPFEDLEEFYERLHDKAVREMDEMVRPLFDAGLQVLERISYGNRLREIVAHSEHNPTDLIIMSSRPIDRSGASPGFASLSHQVAILSQVPVLLVR